MTARVTTLKGLNVGAYYVDRASKYYSAPGEPPGRWMGRGAAALGLDGDVDPAEFENIMGGNDPSGTWVLGRHFGPTSVRAYDLTCSAPKSVSVLWAVAGPDTRAQILEAHDKAVEAVVDLVDRQALTRVTANGVTSVVDSQGITAGVFRHHTSRAGDPQLHSHVVVSARVQAPDGRYLSLDARGLKCDQRTLSAVFHTSFRSELTARLGVTWDKPVNGSAELSAVPERVRREFSTRTTQVAKRLEVKLDRFETNVQRSPTPRERWNLQREAVLDSRPGKTRLGRNPADLHVRWRGQLIDNLDMNPRDLVARCVKGPTRTTFAGPGIPAMVDQALAALTEGQSTWRRNDLIRELARAVPTTVTIGAGRLVPWLEELADHTIATRLRELAPVPEPGTPLRATDGRPVSESVLDRRFTTDSILAQETAVEASCLRRVDAGGGPGNIAPGRLDLAQVDVARAVAGTAQLVLVVGPAGTGKTTALRPAVRSLQAQGRAVVGLAPSATAAAVLGQETGIAYADTVDKYLADSRYWGPPRHRDGDVTLIVDEAGMLRTDKLARLLDLADQRGMRVVLVGDPMQLSAVGRGGMFAHLTRTLPTVELEQVHRFTNPWERDASLQLRAGKAEALEVYDGHGRIHAGTVERLEDQIVGRWRELRHSSTVAVLTPTTETAGRLNNRLQAERHRAGELTGPGLELPDGQTLFVGDLVATRRNDRSLRTDAGEMIRNRARWTIEAITTEGTVTVAGRDGRVTLPAEYVAEHVQLAYAETIHAAQGRTVDHSLLLVDGPTDGAGIYVGLTRGRESNDAYVVTDDTTAIDVLDEAISRTWADRPAIEIRAELDAQARQLDHGRSGPSLGR